MNDKVYIDSIDIFSQYGIFILEGGYNGLLSFPSVKDLESNNWPEEDGVEVDLSELYLNSKEVEIKFAAINDHLTGDFLRLISDKSYHVFDLKEIGYTCKLRLDSSVDIQLLIGAETFSLKFIDDFYPLEGYVYEEPLSMAIPEQGYELDGIDFSNYGIRVLEGSEAQILKTPTVKKNLLQNISNLNGAIYDGELVVFEQKEVTLSCCLIAKDLNEFWKNYKAFLHDLTVSKEIEEDGITVLSAGRSLYVDSSGEEYPCHYKSLKVNLWDPNGNIWCKFSLVLVFISFRVGEQEYLLSSENEELIITEDEEFYIDLKP